MSDRPTDGGETFSTEAGAPTVAESGRCRIIQTGQLTCVEPDTNAYIGVDFEAGEEHAYDRLAWRCKDGTASYGFVVRTGDGDAYLMPHLFERVAEIIGEPVAKAVPQQAVSVRPVVRPVHVINVKGMNKPEQRAAVVYVGRKFAGWPEHELHNPYKPVAGEPVGTCLAKYKARLMARLTLEEDLAALWEETGQGKRPLGCWCASWDGRSAPSPECHAVILATMLKERFGDK